MGIHRTSVVIVAAFAAFLAGCSGSSEAAKRKQIETGKKYVTNNQLKQASLIFRKVIQKDPKYGEAYYQLGLVELKQGRPAEALRALRRASELQIENDDAHSKLADLYISIYLADRKKFRPMLSDLEELSTRLLKRDPKSFEGLRMKGYIALANENPKEAIDSFRQAGQSRPDQPNLALALAQALVADKQIAEAENVITAALVKNKVSYSLYDFLYLLKLGQKKTPEAEAVLKQKLAADPKRGISVLELAAHYMRTGSRAQMSELLASMAANTKDFPDGHEMVGDFSFRIGDFETAQKEYEAALNATPTKRTLLQKKIVETMATRGKLGDAATLADRIITENKNDPEARALRASLRLRSNDRGEIDAAIKDLQAVLPEMPENAVIRYNLGEGLLRRGDVDQAEVQFQESLKIRASYVAPKLALARVSLARRDFVKAQQYADEIVKVNPVLIPARLTRISALIGLNDTKSARAELDDLLSRSPKLADALYLGGMLDLAEQKMGDAEAKFKTLFAGTPPDNRGLLGLIEVYMATKRVDQAKQMLKQEITKAGEAAPLRLALANVYVRSKEFEPAIGELGELIKKAPSSAELHKRLAVTYSMANRLDEAYQSYDKARQLNPGDVDSQLRMAMILESTGKRDKSKPLYETIIKLQPDHPIALNNLAYLLAEADGDLDLALSYAQKAKQKMPTNPDIADTLGWLYIKKNLSEDAIKIFNGLLQQRPEHVTWRYHLAMALFQKGDKLQARKELERALTNKPTPDEENKIRQLLDRIG